LTARLGIRIRPTGVFMNWLEGELKERGEIAERWVTRARPSGAQRHGLPARSGEPGPIPTVMGQLQRLPEQHRTLLVERFDVRDVKSIAIDVNEKYVSLPQPPRVFLRAPYREISRAPVGQHR